MTDYKRIAMIACVAAAGLASSSGLKAFPSTQNWIDDPSQGQHCGGGDIWATGSVRDWGITCAHCHTNNNNQQGLITAQITFTPPLTGGAYSPGVQYAVQVKMQGHHFLPASGGDWNGFVGTFEDQNGNKIGTLQSDSASGCPAEPPNQLVNGMKIYNDNFVATGTTYTYGDCHAVASLGKKSTTPITTWNFKWTAPAAGAGAAIFYWGIVDSNTDESSLNDDVKMGKQMIAQGP